MKVVWYQLKRTYTKPHGGFLAIAALPWRAVGRWLGGLFTHPGDAQWTEVVPVERLEEAPEAPKPRRRWK